MHCTIRLLLFIFISALGTNVLAQTGFNRDAKTRILFIYDASNSMNGSWQKGKKHTIAQRLLSETIDEMQNIPNLETALRVYGHQKYYRNGQDCNDTKLEVPFAAKNAKQIKAKLKSITPKGTTPIAMTLEKSAEDFSDCSNCRNIIILITDGIEECGGDPCAISMKLQRQGIVLKPFVIGIGLDVNFKKSFECLGTFYDASDEATFKKVLDIVISQALNETSAQVNLIDAAKNPSETDVAVSLYDHFSGRLLYHFMHTMDAKGNPDTLDLEANYTYDMVAHTVPPVRTDSLTMTPGKHNLLGVDAPQGFINIEVNGFNSRTPVQAIVRQHKKTETVFVQELNSTEKYLVGFYDIEILTLPRVILEDIVVSQSHTTTVELPNPGLLTVTKKSKGSGGIFIDRNGKLEKVIKLDENQARESFYLQPGEYLLVYRANGAQSTSFNKQQKFTIRTGSSASINL
jgi:Ca-activated chloride channel family protein|tara:strand:- start:981 stop:2360 length:1380 start_codon:yes stop_codon:yes gene_type:complete